MPIGDNPISSNHTFKPTMDGDRNRSQFATAPAGNADINDKMAAFIALDEKGVSELTTGELKEIARFSAVSAIGIEAMVAKQIPRAKAEELCKNGMDPAKLPFHLKLSGTEQKAFDALCATAGANELSIGDFEAAGLRVDVAEKLFGAVQDKLKTADEHIGAGNFTTTFTAVQFSFERTDLAEKGTVNDAYRNAHSGKTSTTQNTFVPDVSRFETKFRNHFEQVVADNKTLGLPNAGAVVDLSVALNTKLGLLKPDARRGEIRNMANDVAERMTRTETFQSKKASFDQFMPLNKIRVEIGPKGNTFDPFSHDLSSKQAKVHSKEILTAFKENYGHGLGTGGDFAKNTGAAFEAILNHPGLTTEDKVAALAYIIDPTISGGSGQATQFENPNTGFMTAVNNRVQGTVGKVDFGDLVVKEKRPNGGPNDVDYRANTAGLRDMVQKFEAQQGATLTARAADIYNTLGGNK